MWPRLCELDVFFSWNGITEYVDKIHNRIHRIIISWTNASCDMDLNHEMECLKNI